MQDIREKLIDLLTGYSLDTYEDVQYVADELIAKGVVPAVRCSECVLSESCTLEDTFRLVAGIENPFCCVGKRKDGDG